jgi:hypothetical protein
MIIGINGYAGSGKDTIGKLIQIATCIDLPEGLDLEEMINNSDHSWWIEDGSGWEIKKWAGKLKTVASLLTGIPLDKFEDQEFKKTNLGPEWSYLGPSCDGGKTRFSTADLVEKQITVRDFLQRLGTDACRDGLHENTWVNALMADYEGLYDLDTDRTTWPNWIITDTRFPNEAQAIKNAGGIVIRVDRPGYKPINDHPSETGLDNWDFDHKIMNGSDLTSLLFSVGNILRKENLL